MRQPATVVGVVSACECYGAVNRLPAITNKLGASYVIAFARDRHAARFLAGPSTACAAEPKQLAVERPPRRQLTTTLSDRDGHVQVLFASAQQSAACNVSQSWSKASMPRGPQNHAKRRLEKIAKTTRYVWNRTVLPFVQFKGEGQGAERKFGSALSTRAVEQLLAHPVRKTTNKSGYPIYGRCQVLPRAS